MLGNAHTVAPSPAMVSRDIAKGPIDGQICRSGYLGGRNRLGCSGANPCESVLQSGFFMGGTQTPTIGVIVGPAWAEDQKTPATTHQGARRPSLDMGDWVKLQALRWNQAGSERNHPPCALGASKAEHCSPSLPGETGHLPCPPMESLCN